MKTLRILLGAVGLFLAQSVSGAGVTIITHGYEPPYHPHPDWVDEMGAAIAKRAGPSAAVVKLDIAFGTTTRELQSGSFPAGGSSDGEIIIKVFWNKLADAGLNPTTTEIAMQILPYLTSSLSWNGTTTLPFAQMPIHLIGHSRGGSVVSELARLLGERGIWVNQVTMLLGRRL